MFISYLIIFIFLFYQKVNLRLLSSSEYLIGKKCYTKETTLNYILFKNANYSNLFDFDHKSYPKKFGYISFKILLTFHLKKKKETFPTIKSPPVF